MLARWNDLNGALSSVAVQLGAEVIAARAAARLAPPGRNGVQCGCQGVSL